MLARHDAKRCGVCMAQMDDQVGLWAHRSVRITIAAVCALVLLGLGFAAGLGVSFVYNASSSEWLVDDSPMSDNAGGGGQVAAGVPDGIDQAARERQLGEIWDILTNEYVDDTALDTSTLYFGAAEGLVAAVGDPHTVYIEPEPAAVISEDLQGVFDGIGATVVLMDDRLYVVQPLPDSPAERAGLSAGDVILAVDGESLAGKSISEALSLIRGPRGSEVQLLIEREGVAEPFEVAIVRDQVEAPVVYSRMLDGGIAYLALNEYNAIAGDRLHEALTDLMTEDPVGLILDLRGNPGGYLSVAVDVTSEFLPQDALVLTERERGQEPREYRAGQTGQACDLPLVVLVNGGSASAAEITAGSLRSNGRAVLIGQTTYGKGSVQDTHTFDDGSTLRVTVARWYLPDGSNLDEQGLVPDFEVVSSEQDVAQGIDAQLERAVEYLQNVEG